jgi:hypothetical protein
MKAPQRRFRWTLCLFLANAPGMTGCFAMSSYQSARMTEPGPARPTIAVSSMGPTDEPEAERMTVIDVRVRKALVRDRADIALTGSVYTIGEGSMASVGIDPRFAIVNNFLALGLPVSWPMGAPAIQYAPGIIATLPLSRYFEVNAAARMIGFASQYGVGEALPAYNVGIGVSRDLRRWAIRPEVGFMPTGDDRDEWIVQFGVGVDLPVDAN